MFLVLEGHARGTAEARQSLSAKDRAQVAMPDSTVLHGRPDAQPSFRATKPVVSEQRRESQHSNTALVAKPNWKAMCSCEISIGVTMLEMLVRTTTLGSATRPRTESERVTRAARSCYMWPSSRTRGELDQSRKTVGTKGISVAGLGRAHQRETAGLLGVADRTRKAQVARARAQAVGAPAIR